MTTRIRRTISLVLAVLLALALAPLASAASDYDRPGQKLLALPFDPLFLGMAVCAVIMAFGLIRGKPHVEHAEKETV